PARALCPARRIVFRTCCDRRGRFRSRRSSGPRTGRLVRAKTAIGSASCRPLSILAASDGGGGSDCSRPLVFQRPAPEAVEDARERRPQGVAGSGAGGAQRGRDPEVAGGFGSRALSSGKKRPRHSAIGLECDQRCLARRPARRAGRAALSASSETGGVRGPDSGLCERLGPDGLGAYLSSSPPSARPSASCPPPTWSSFFPSPPF